MEKLTMDIQLFANDGLIGDGVEDDDPTVKDDIPETDDGSVDDELDDDLASLLGTDEEEEPEEEQEEETEEEPEEPTEEEPPKNGKFYTQAEIDAMISSRIQREREKYQHLDELTQKVKHLERAAGMDFDSILNHIRDNRVQAYVDAGEDEEAARKRVDMELEYEEIKERMNRNEQYIQNMTRSMNYNREKAAVINSNPLYRKYEAEIDEFAQFGAVLSFEDAAKYVIGDKVARGELLDDVRKGAEAKALAIKGAKIESGSQPGGNKQALKMTSLERKAARAFGISEKEWMDSKKALNKKR